MGWNKDKPQAPIIPTAFDDRNWVLWGDGKVDGGQSTPTMKFSVAKNQPRITVYTGRKTGPDNRSESLWARMSPYGYYNFLALLEMVTRGKPGVRYAQKNDTMIPDKQNPGKKKQITETQTWVGKDDNGIVWIAVTKYNAPNVQFQLKPPRFHDILEANGQPMDRAMASALTALEFIRVQRNLLATVLAVTFDADSQSVPQKNDSWKKKSDNNNNSYSNRNSGNDRNSGNNNQWNNNNSNSSNNSSSGTSGWKPQNDNNSGPLGDDDDDAAPAFQGLPL